MNSEKETANTLRRLNRFALILGTLSIPIAFFIGIYAYSTSRNVLMESTFNQNLELAILLGEYAGEADPSTDSNQFVKNLDTMWQKMKEQHTGSYLCLIDKDAKLLTHTARPQMVGQNVGDNHIETSDKNNISNLQDLLQAKQNWVGHYTSLAKQKQVTAFAYLPHRESLLAIHVPLSHIEAELQAIIMPWVFGVGGIIFVLFPITLGLLYRASISSQRLLTNANTHLQKEMGERLEAEQNVEDAYTLLEQTFASLEDGVLVLDPSRTILSCNPAIEKLFGYKTEEIIGHHTDILHVDNEYYERFGDEVKAAFNEDNLASFEFKMKRKNGYVFPTEHTIKKFRGTPDDQNYTVSVIRDITERKKMQQALIEGEERFSQLATHIQEVFWMTDTTKNEMLFISPAYESIWGRTCESLYNSAFTWVEAIHPEDRERIETASLAKQKRGDYDEEYRIIRPDGTIRIIHDRAFPIKNEQGDIYRIAGIAEDITERKRTEQEQIRIQRISALGELSAGISHNLNNILSGIMGPAQMLKMSAKDPLFLQDIDTILTSSMRAKELVHRLHLSTRGLDNETLKPIEMNKIIEQAIQGTQPRWKDEPESNGIAIAIETHLEPVSAIQGTESTCYDLLVNLIFNAVDAMPTGGTISIQTQQDKDHVILTFTDTGLGMDDETKLRIFEPFFTTKVDLGTGLGLCTVYNTVVKWGGQIDVHTELGKGTRFVLQLPISTVQNIQKTDPVDATQKRIAKILIVEDDNEIRQFLTRFLSKDHKVTSIQNGQKALDIFAPNEYDVAIIDLGLPEIPGDQIAQKMHALDASLATILITGWELPQNDNRLSAFDFKIQKPFHDISAISQLVNQAVVLHDERLKKIKNI